MSTSDEIKQAMEGCKRGIQLLEARVKNNSEQVADRNRRVKDWERRRDEANAIWERGKTNRENSQREWDNRRNNIANDKRGERRETDRHEPFNSNGNWCHEERSGWVDDGDRDVGWVGALCCRHRRRCKKGEDLVNRESEEQTRRERGDRPGNWNEPKFSEEQPKDAQIDTSPITVGCCANELNIVGSDLNQTSINQSNSCLSNLQNTYDKKVEAERIAAEREAARIAAEREAARIAAEREAARIVAEREAARQAASEAAIKLEILKQKIAADKVLADKALADKAEADKIATDKNKKIMIVIALILVILSCIGGIIMMS